MASTPKEPSDNDIYTLVLGHEKQMLQLCCTALTENLATFRTMLDHVRTDAERDALFINIRRVEGILAQGKDTLANIERSFAQHRARRA